MRGRVAVRSGCRAAIAIATTGSVVTIVAAAHLPAARLAIACSPTVGPVTPASAVVACAEIVCPGALRIEAAGPTRFRWAAAISRPTRTIGRTVRRCAAAIIVNAIADVGPARIDGIVAVVAILPLRGRIFSARTAPTLCVAIKAIGVVIAVKIEIIAVLGVEIVRPAVAVVVKARVAVF